MIWALPNSPNLSKPLFLLPITFRHSVLLQTVAVEFDYEIPEYLQNAIQYQRERNSWHTSPVTGAEEDRAKGRNEEKFEFIRSYINKNNES